MNRRDKDPWLIFLAMVVLCFCASTCRGEPLDTGGWRATAEGRIERCNTDTSGVVRLTILEPGGMIGYGSGVLIRLPTGEDGYVLTVAHNVADGAGKISICVDGRVCSPGTLVGTDLANDLALIRIRLDDCGGVPIAESDPTVGARVSLWGMGPKDAQKLGRSGQCTGYRSFVAAPSVGSDLDVRDGHGVLVVSAPARGGDSGGPILDASGRLVGLVTGSDHKSESIGPCCCRIKAFLNRLCPQGRRPSPKQHPLPGPAPIAQPAPDVPLPVPAESLVPVEPVTPSPCAGLEALNARLDLIDAKIEEIAARPGVKGDPGERGEQGEPGEPGNRSKIHLDLLRGSVAQTLSHHEEFIARIVDRLRSDETFLQAIADKVDCPSPKPQDLNEDDIGAIADKVRQRISGEIHYEWVPETIRGEE